MPDIVKRIVRKEIFYHIIAWFVYFGFMYFLNYLAKPESKVISIIFFELPIIITFYLIVFTLRLRKLTVTWGFGTFLIIFGIMAFVAYGYLYFVLPKKNINIFSSTKLNVFIANTLVQFIRVFSIALIYVYLKDLVLKKRQISSLEIQKQELEKQQIQAELKNAVLKKQHLEVEQQKLQYEYAFLRAQVNPHFLHNTLNVLYSQAMPYSDDLANNILKLSAIMRYSLESLEFESGKVPIQKELEHLQNVIEVNNLRFGDSRTIHYEVDGYLNGQMVPPLSLITVVENAFKYGDLKDPQNPLYIKVKLEPGEVYFYCRNKKRTHNLQLPSTSIGMSNLEKRLDKAFMGKYQMNVKDENNTYTFEIRIKT